MKSLHKFVDPDCLPENYGGTLPAMNYTTHDWYPELLKHHNVPKGKLQMHICKWIDPTKES